MSPAFQNIGGARALAIGLAPSFTSIALLPPHLLSFLPSPPPPSLPSSNGVSRCHRRLSGRREREKKRPAWLCLRPPGRSLAAAAAEDVGQPSLHHLALGKRERGSRSAGGRPVTAECKHEPVSDTFTNVKNCTNKSVLNQKYPLIFSMHKCPKKIIS